MKKIVVFIALLPITAFAATQVPSNAYMEKYVTKQIDAVEQELAKKVDTSAGVTQELNGTYTVTNKNGLIVPTQDLPAITIQ